MDQRVGMPMHLPPLRSLTAKDPGHPERPVLFWQTTDPAMLAFDHRQHYEISRRVRLHQFQFRLTTPKEALQGFEALGRGVGSPLPQATWMEHHPKEATDGVSETFELVVFSSYMVTERAPYLGETRLTIEEPAWKSLDRATVETLVGQEV
jgi:hypothetical protein